MENQNKQNRKEETERFAEQVNEEEYLEGKL